MEYGAEAHHQPMTDDAVARIETLFDQLSSVYDPEDVPFFQPIAAGLVELLAPRPGERVLDLGCGKGAATLPLAVAVGPTGAVTAVDIAAGMVDALDRAVSAAHLGQVTTHRADVSDPDPAWGTFDVVAASLVLFFLPDPPRALRRWADRVTNGGRIGISTFGPQDEVWRAVDASFAPYLPPQMLDARTSGAKGPFSSDAAVEELFGGADIGQVRTATSPVTVAFDDVDQWRRWSMTTGQRQMWQRIPADDVPAFVDRAAALLESARGASGRIELVQQVRYTVGVVDRRRDRRDRRVSAS